MLQERPSPLVNSPKTSRAAQTRVDGVWGGWKRSNLLVVVVVSALAVRLNYPELVRRLEMSGFVGALLVEGKSARSIRGGRDGVGLRRRQAHGQSAKRRVRHRGR